MCVADATVKLIKLNNCLFRRLLVNFYLINAGLIFNSSVIYYN